MAAQSKKKKKIPETKKGNSFKRFINFDACDLFFFFLPKQQNVDFVPFAARTERASQFISKNVQSRCLILENILCLVSFNVLKVAKCLNVGIGYKDRSQITNPIILIV